MKACVWIFSVFFIGCYPFDMYVLDWLVGVFVGEYLWYWVSKDMQHGCRNSSL